MPANITNGLTVPDVNDLTIDQMRSLIGSIQNILWYDNREDCWDPDVQWDSETIEWVSAAMEDHGLKPRHRQ